MPFSKYGADPSLMEAMRDAFKRVCAALQLNCGAEDPITEVVVLKIVELAKAGETDPERLCACCWPAWKRAPAPLTRQSEAYRREGVDIDESTLADWVGSTVVAVDPVIQALRTYVGTRLMACLECRVEGACGTARSVWVGG
jgi:hypothetical protein